MAHRLARATRSTTGLQRSGALALICLALMGCNTEVGRSSFDGAANFEDTGSATHQVIAFDPDSWEHDDTVDEQRHFFDLYRPTKRRYNSLLKYHVFGTSGVYNDLIDATYQLVKNMLEAMNSDDLRAKLEGTHIFLITLNDPGLNGESPG